MTFQHGQTYRMKTYIHDFLDTVIVLALYTENGYQTVIVQRHNGQIINLTEQDIAAADYYLLDDETHTDV